jgi:hypothetical protein
VSPSSPALRVAALASACCIALSSGRADEGFWPLDRLPASVLKQRYAFVPTQEWVRHAQAASLQIAGASGSFVSADGLIMTVYHVGRRVFQRIDLPGVNLAADGYCAATPDREVKCPGASVQVLLSIEDVTDSVERSVKPGSSAAAAESARAEASEAAVAEARKGQPGDYRVVVLFNGLRRNLYRYKTYSDVRLVFAPGHAAADFGGGRGSSDGCFRFEVSFFRAYEDGRPAKTPDYFRFSPSGPTEGDLVFELGNPVSSARLMTAADAEFERDVRLPFELARLENREVELGSMAQKGGAESGLLLRELGAAEAIRGDLESDYQALLDPEVIKIKADADAREQARMAGGAGGANSPWRQLAEADRAEAAHYKAFQLLVRAGSDPDRALFRQSLIFTARELGGGSPVVEAILGGRTPGEWADDASGSMTAFARRLDSLAAPEKAAFESAAAAAGEARRGIALGLLGGPEAVAPDASGSLRLSFGVVKGFSENGARVGPFTTFDGLYRRSDAHPGDSSFKLARAWAAGRGKVDPDTPLDFTSTCDIAGGSSGSAVIDRDGQLVGVMFGNIHNYGRSYYVYWSDRGRAVALDSRAILQALRRIYRADALAGELEGAQR